MAWGVGTGCWGWECGWGALRGNEPTRAEEARGEVGLSRCARWGWVIASKARFGSLPLLPRAVGHLEGVWRDRLFGGLPGGAWRLPFWGQAAVGMWRILLRYDELEGGWRRLGGRLRVRKLPGPA